VSDMKRDGYQPVVGRIELGRPPQGGTAVVTPTKVVHVVMPDPALAALHAQLRALISKWRESNMGYDDYDAARLRCADELEALLPVSTESK
jgi:hypothetical protein